MPDGKMMVPSATFTAVVCMYQFWFGKTLPAVA